MANWAANDYDAAEIQVRRSFRHHEMSQLVLYLDTNHLSNLARGPSAPEAQAVIRLLQSGRSRLAVSLMHFVELASPGFASVADARALLRDVPVAWTLSTAEVWDSEIAVACAKARGLTREPPRVFCSTALDWSRGPSPAPGNAADFLDAVIEQPAERESLLRAADEAARTTMLKTDAALIKHPDIPLLRFVEDHLAEGRRRTAGYADGLDAADVVRLSGGYAAVPSLHLFHSTIGQRLRLVAQKSTRNDVFDDYHAAYAPYAATTALDRGTAARVRSAGLAERHRVTACLGDVPGLIDDVESGKAPLVASAGL